MKKINQSSGRSRSRVMTSLMLVSLCLQTLTGCSRRFWREQAEEQSYSAIGEKMNDDRWVLPRVDMTPDPRSRFHDPFDPDEEPLPPDDPAAHEFMHCVDGHRGSKHWHEFGDAPSIENPAWLKPYAILLQSGDPVEGHAKVDIPKVTLSSSIDLAYIHSREYQTEIEDVYLAALTVTQRRYQFGTRFLVGGISDLGGVNVGGGGVGGRSGVGGGLLTSGIRRGSDNNTGAFSTGFGVTRLMPWGMQVSTDILNTISFGANGSGTATSLAWNITQPVLNGAGRKLVMESLTQSERTLLYEVRTLARFRQQLFTNVASDYLAILRQIQNITNRRNNIRQLEEQIEIRQAEDNRTPLEVKEPLTKFPEGAVIPESLTTYLTFVESPNDPTLSYLKWKGPLTEQQKQQLLDLSDDNLYQTAVRQLIRWKETQVVSLRVAQLVTQLNGSQNNLEDDMRVLSDLQDGFKIRLGLPPNVSLSIDDMLLGPFQLIAPEIVSVEQSLKDLARNQGTDLIPAPEGAAPDQRFPPEYEVLQTYVAELQRLSERVRASGLEAVKADFVPIRAILAATENDFSKFTPGQRYFRNEEERDRVIKDVARDLRLFRINERDFERTSQLITLVNELFSAGNLDELVGSLDTNGDKAISRTELPLGWSSLPRAGSVKDDETLSPSDLLASLRDAAISLREDLLQTAQSLQVAQVGLRVEAIALNPLRLPGEKAPPEIEKVVEIGLNNHHDLMNARAAVMDSRRAVEIAARALMSTLNLSASGTSDLDGIGDLDNVDLTVDIKTPITQIAQRNAYNEALVAYQRQRRTYMALEDTIKLAIRQSWRQLMVSEERLEIDRQTVRNAALQYDNAALEATGAEQGGQNNNSLNLLNALDAVLDAQNSLVRDWITYEINRLQIFRDMGIMQIDSDGVWEDEFYQADGQLTSEDMPAPADLFPELQLPSE